MPTQQTKRLSGADTIIRSFDNAVSLWQTTVRLVNGVHRLELIRVGSALILMHDYPDGDGWEAFAPVTDDGRIDSTLEAIAKRGGVPLKAMAPHA